ncbi:hypothetical protein CHS0354_016310 [Potamilus streckersoni]|uniref:Uncharacterized protein n=1 Tax=Potamilus streckersoni TaxID=2493646 RepID=A0AAE0VFN1_9BIVA|nr:hypothetical protein CHS0354_016310 [Potamilus streckersoni]
MTLTGSYGIVFTINEREVRHTLERAYPNIYMHHEAGGVDEQFNFMKITLLMPKPIPSVDYLLESDNNLSRFSTNII